MLYNYNYILAVDYINKSPDSGRIIHLDSLQDDNRQPLEIYYLNEIFLISYLGVILTEDGIVIKDSALNDTILEHAANHAMRYISYEQQAICLEGEYVSLLGIWSNTFFHWILEFLPKVIIAEKAGFKGKYLVNPREPYTLETLELLGIYPDRLIQVKEDNSHFVIETLVVIPRIDIYSCERYYLEALKEIRQKILSHIESPSAKKKYFISRKKASNGRNIVNEEEVTNLMKNYGIIPIILEDLPFIEQVKLVSNSDCLIGSHGAGMVHSLFMPEKSKVVEFFSPNYINHCFTPIFKLMKHKYNMVVSQVSEANKYIYGEEVQVPLNILKIILENNLGMFL